MIYGDITTLRMMAASIKRSREIPMSETAARIEELTHQVRHLEQTKNFAYGERNKLVALLSKLFPASLERHREDDKDWEDDWRWIVFIDLPTGQACWHIHDDELPMYDHLKRNEGRVWDGHTTEQKYERIAAFDRDSDLLYSLIIIAARARHEYVTLNADGNYNKEIEEIDEVVNVNNVLVPSLG